MAIICGSVQIASHNSEEWRQYLKLNDSICAIILIVVGVIILASFVLQLAIKYLPKTYTCIRRLKDSNITPKIVIGLFVCCAVLLLVAVVLSFSDIQSVNKTDEAAIVTVLDNNYVDNSTSATTTSITVSDTTNTETSSSAWSSTPTTDNLTMEAYPSNSNNFHVNGPFYQKTLLTYMTSSETEDEADFSIIVDTLQQKLKCCGVTSYTDWSKTDWGRGNPDSVPDSCCISKSQSCGMHYTSTNNIFTEGCFTVIARKIIKKAVTYVVVSILVIILDFLSAKYKVILDILPNCLSDKVMERRAKAQNTKDSKASTDSEPRKKKTGKSKGDPSDPGDNQEIQDRLNITIHVFTGAPSRKDGSIEERNPFKTFCIPKVPESGVIVVDANPNVALNSSVKATASVANTNAVQVSHSTKWFKTAENVTGTRVGRDPTLKVCHPSNIDAMDITDSGSDLQHMSADDTMRLMSKMSVSSSMAYSASSTHMSSSSSHNELSLGNFGKSDEQSVEVEC